MDNRIWFGKTGGNVPSVIFLSKCKLEQCPLRYGFVQKLVTMNLQKEIKSYFLKSAIFETPKPVTLLKKIIQLSTEKNSIILDSFAGSGTTAHAVLEQNKEDVGSRRLSSSKWRTMPTP